MKMPLMSIHSAAPRVDPIRLGYILRAWLILAFLLVSISFVHAGERNVDWLPANPDGVGELVCQGKIWDLTGDVLNTTDSLNWTAVARPALLSSANWVKLAFNDRLWLIDSTDKDYYGNPAHQIWCSDDGAQWRLATAAPAFPARSNPTMTTFNGKMWLIGGQAASG